MTEGKMTVEEIARRLTKAQIWALIAIAEGHGKSPASLGGRMMDRPGVEERRRGGNRDSAQGLGRVGGTMMKRLSAMGLLRLRTQTRDQWHTTEAELTSRGLAIRDHLATRP